MAFWWSEMLRCPVCGSALNKEGNSLYCGSARRHCFDVSAAGYVNLAASRAAGGGDDAALIRARTAFLGAGHYFPIAERIAALAMEYAPAGRILDAGCGEGYYTAHLARKGLSVLGVDLSKNGIRHAARAAADCREKALFAVAGIFDLPVQDESADAVISLFAPVAEAEFCRVLRSGGVLIVAGAGPRHLYELKGAIYDTPYLNQPRADLPCEMELMHEENLIFSMDLNRDELAALFAMTPYFYRTSKEGRSRLNEIQQLAVGADVSISVYRKA